MLNLQEMKEAIGSLSPEEVRELREHLERRASEIQPSHVLSPDERIRRLEAVARAIRVSFTDAEWDVVEQAMNEE